MTAGEARRFSVSPAVILFTIGSSHFKTENFNLVVYLILFITPL